MLYLSVSVSYFLVALQNFKMLTSFLVSLNILPPFRIFIAITVKQILYYLDITLCDAVGTTFSTSKVLYVP